MFELCFLKKKIKILKEAPEVVNSVPIWAYSNRSSGASKELIKNDNYIIPKWNSFPLGSSLLYVV